MNKKIYAVMFILAALGGVAFVAAMTSEVWTINVPAGQPTPTTTFTVVATPLSSGVTISPDTKTITITEGAVIGTVYQIEYILTSTANQIITITPNVVAPGITYSWDETSLTLNQGAHDSMVLSITLGENSGTISVNFNSVLT